MNVRHILTPEFRLRLVKWLVGGDIGVVMNARVWWDSRGQCMRVNGKNVCLFFTENAHYYADGKALKSA